jgi:citrate synthase
VDEVTHHTFVHENVKKFIDGFHHDAHPMGILCSTVAGRSTFYPEARTFATTGRGARDHPHDREDADDAAFAYRHATGLPYAYPDNRLSYAATSST